MNFNEAQSKLIYDFVMKYNSEEEFRNKVQKSYENEPDQLSILHIYALEEILRFGTRGLYSKFLETKGAYSESEAATQYDTFMKC